MTQDRVLLLCHRIPYPPDKGDKIRSYNLLKTLAARFDVVLGAFYDDPDDAKWADSLRELTVDLCLLPLTTRDKIVRGAAAFWRGEAISSSWLRAPSLSRWVEAKRQDGLVAEVAYSGAMAPYLEDATVPVFVDLVDADSLKWAAYAQDAPLWRRPIFRREAQKIAALERNALSKSAASFVVSPEEAEAMAASLGAAPNDISWFRNGVNTDYWRPDASFDSLAERFDVVFVGAMDYPPNVEAVEAFVSQVWPGLRDARPNLRFGIIGTRPVPSVQALGEQPGVTVTGRVEDVRPYLAAASVSVAPLKIARGVQNKVLEAMAMGVPVVATPEAAAGTGAYPDHHLLVAENAKAMEEAVLSVLSDEALAHRLSAQGIDFIRDVLPWNKTTSRFREEFSRAGISWD